MCKSHFSKKSFERCKLALLDLTKVMAAEMDSFITSPSLPVNMCLPVPSFATASSCKISPPKEVHARPFTKPTLLSESLEVDIPYDTGKDIAFFTEPDLHVNRVVLEPGNFVLLYPHEAHKPQIRAFDGPQEVKKAVVKIPVSVTKN